MMLAITASITPAGAIEEDWGIHLNHGGVTKTDKWWQYRDKRAR